MSVPCTPSDDCKPSSSFGGTVTQHTNHSLKLTEGYRTIRLIQAHIPSLLLLHPFNSLFSRTTWVSRYQKSKTSLDLHEARVGGVLGCGGISWTICKQSAPRSREITTPTPRRSIFTGRMLFLMPNQWCQSTKDNIPYPAINRLLYSNCSLRHRTCNIPHFRCTQIIPLYSPDGADVHPHLIHGSSVCVHTLQTAS